VRGRRGEREKRRKGEEEKGRRGEREKVRKEKATINPTIFQLTSSNFV